MLIPQGLAYASLASLPPQYGIYAAMMSVFIYPFFGTSPQLAVGPVALMSLLTTGLINEMDLGDAPDDRRILLALRLAFVVGVIQTAMGIFNAGSLVSFLSHPMLSGFTAAAAIIIGSSQLGKLLGLKLVRSSHVYEVWIDAVEKLGDTHLLTLGLAAANLAMFWGLKWGRKFLLSVEKRRASSGREEDVAVAERNSRILKAVPNALIVVIVNIIIVTVADLESEGVAIVGKLSNGLPSPVNIFASGFGDDFNALLPTAFLMALVGFMESISVAKAMALKYGNKLDSNQELLGLGLANVIGAPFNTFPVTGGFSRTTVNADAGAATTLAGLITGIILLVTVLVLLPLFKNLPAVTLGALIVFAVSKLLDHTVPLLLWQLDKGDFAVYVVAFLATLGLGIEEGIMVGAGVSLAKVVWFASRPHAAVLGQVLSPITHKPTDMFRKLENYPDLTQEVPGLRILRFDGALMFANAEYFEELVLGLAKPSTDPADLTAPTPTEPQAIVVDMGSVASLDSTALHIVEHLPVELRTQSERWRATRLAAAKNALADGSHDEAAAQREVDAMQAQLEGMKSGTVTAPRLFLVSVRGPVRATLHTSHHVAEAEKAAAAAYTGGCWHCEVTVQPREVPATSGAHDPTTLPMDLAQALEHIQHALDSDAAKQVEASAVAPSDPAAGEATDPEV